MTLTLEVVGPEATKLGAASRKVFHAGGGTIGRLPENSWVLPDPYVSSRHAVIRYADGVFYIEDTSTNGIYINSPDNCLVRGEPYALKSGDWIFIEPYEIRAAVTDSQNVAPSPFDDVFGATAPNRAGGRDRVLEPRNPPPMDLIPASGESELDPLKLIDGDDAGRPLPPRAPRAVEFGPPAWSEPIELPRPVRPAAPATAAEGSATIPENWFDESTAGGAPPPLMRSEPRVPSARVEPAVAAKRPRPGAPRAVEEPNRPAVASSVVPESSTRESIELADILAAAGVGGVTVSPEAARDFGLILRVVIAGVMDMLRARQQTKSALGLAPTVFKRAENNPLKFSSDVEDALHNLFVTRRPGFLGPVEGFEDAFEDIKHHQIAMLHGMRTAFAAMLAEFDPDRLQLDFDKQLKKGALVAVPAKLRYWDMYRETFREMVKDPDRAFRRLFGDEFASAYEEQLSRLKERGHERNS